MESPLLTLRAAVDKAGSAAEMARRLGYDDAKTARLRRALRGSTSNVGADLVSDAQTFLNGSAALPGGGPERLGYLEEGAMPNPVASWEGEDVPEDVYLIIDLPGGGEMHLTLASGVRRVGPPARTRARFRGEDLGQAGDGAPRTSAAAAPADQSPPG